MENTNNSRFNHLAGEMSPYLQQHARNPVDWHPWGDEAFARAKLENKPILLSIGYSTCHWCHVMEKESFSDTATADLMNRYFINIKVDREERPDIDQIYMTAVSALTGSGGWPLNVFLTPDRKPFFGGTYFPPTRRNGMSSWPDLLEIINQNWCDPEQRAKITESAAEITSIIEKHLSRDGSCASPDDGLIERALDFFADQYDDVKGGFSPAPKFPSPGIQHFLFDYASSVKKRNNGRAQKALDMALRTLDAMANGGIYDHVGGGFHRYATDTGWHVPHFEKMLYDNAQLVMNYIDAFRLTGNRRYADVAGETIGYVLRDLRHPEGGFYSAEDADSYPSENALEKVEGAFYVWDLKEIESILGVDESRIFAIRYGLKPGGNVAHDPFGEFQGKNILHAVQSIDETARHFGLTEEAVKGMMGHAFDKLRQVRGLRMRPHRDEKILTDWNGLMISAMAMAGRFLDKPEYTAEASNAVAFIFRYLYDAADGRLFRAWRDGKRKGEALASDYAFLIRGLLDLYEADFNQDRLKRAVDLNERMIGLFMDTKIGGIFMTAGNHDPNLILRVRDDADNVVPSAAAVAAGNLMRLGRMTGNTAYRELAERIMAGASGRIGQYPGAGHGMLAEMCAARNRQMRILIAGRLEDAHTREFIRTATENHEPGTSVILMENDETRKALIDLLGDLPMTDISKTNVYVCDDGGCREPATDIAGFEKLIHEGY